MGYTDERKARNANLHEKRQALISKVKTLRESGLTVKEIAEKLGIKEATVLICVKHA